MASAAGQQQQQQQRRTSTHGDATMTMATSNKWELTPLPLFLRMLGYLDNPTFMILCRVCQQIRDLIWSGHGMDNKLIRIFELQASEGNDDNDTNSSKRLRCFVSNMDRYFHDPKQHRMLQQYQYWKIVHGDFDYGFEWVYTEFDQLVRNMSMTGILSLDVSSSELVFYFPHFLLRAISRMLPNLRQLDLSNVYLEQHILQGFLSDCRHLEIIKWNFNNNYEFGENFYFERLDANAGFLDTSEQMSNLKELYLDNRVFMFNDVHDDNNDIVNESDDDSEYDHDEYDAMSDLNEYPNRIFLNDAIRNTPLEKISIRNAQYCFIESCEQDVIPQDMLIKCVRNAPSTLVWFRSNLSEASIHLLQAERPGIEFVQ